MKSVGTQNFIKRFVSFVKEHSERGNSWHVHLVWLTLDLRTIFLKGPNQLIWKLRSLTEEKPSYLRIILRDMFNNDPICYVNRTWCKKSNLTKSYYVFFYNFPFGIIWQIFLTLFDIMNPYEGFVMQDFVSNARSKLVKLGRIRKTRCPNSL